MDERSQRQKIAFLLDDNITDKRRLWIITSLSL